MFLFKCKKSKIEQNTPQVDEKNILLFTNIITQANEILKINTVGKGELHPIFSFAKQFTDLLSIEGAMSTYKGFNANTSKYVAQVFEGSRSSYSKNKIERIITDLLTEEALEECLKHGYKNVYIKTEFNLSNYPVILNTWKSSKITDALSKIATKENPFDKDKYSGNINNFYYYPMGVILCNGANHSQYSALLKGKGITSVREIVNVEKLYRYISFNGDYFIYNFSNEEGVIKQERQKIMITTNIEFYSGVLFEIGRLLLDRKDIFPSSIQEVLK